MGLPPLTRPTIDIVLPVYNEEAALEAGVLGTLAYTAEHLPWPATVTIADNASTDDTEAIGRRLAELPRVRYVRLPEKGRGRALKLAWATSEADIAGYMDIDLSTGLSALPALLAPLVSGHAEVAIGSRLLPQSRVVRGLKREVLSRGYNTLIRASFWPSFHDAQCGFKAARREALDVLLPEIADNEWFFDTELLLLAERRGMRVFEVPVDWHDDPTSTVRIGNTVRQDLRGLCRMRTAFWRDRLGGGRGHQPTEAGHA